VSVSAPKVLDRLAGGAVLQALRPLRFWRDVRAGDAPLGAVREIAVVKFWGVGNAALLLPVLQALKRRYPAARLTVVTLAENRPLYAAVADRVLTVRMRPLPRTLLDLLRVLARLRRLRIDLALDFEQFARASQVLLFLARPQQGIAFDTRGQRRAALADVEVAYDDARHCGEGFLALARAAGVREQTYRPGGLAVEPQAAARVARWGRSRGLGKARPLVVLHPGSGDNFPGRRWPTRRFGLLARQLVDRHGAVVAVTGGRAEAHLAREVVEASAHDVDDLTGRLTLQELIALLARATLVVSNDTGPVHLASALGVPVIGLYGPNTPQLYGPRSAGSVAFYDAPPCSPCITNFNYKTSRCRNPVCIRAIEVDAVATAASRLLRARRAERA
jgi:lipopolysaccharide heptosyltransferase II